MGRYFRTLVDSALLGDTLYFFRKRFLGSTAYAQDPGRSIVVRCTCDMADDVVRICRCGAAATCKESSPPTRRSGRSEEIPAESLISSHAEMIAPSAGERNQPTGSPTVN